MKTMGIWVEDGCWKLKKVKYRNAFEPLRDMKGLRLIKKIRDFN